MSNEAEKQELVAVDPQTGSQLSAIVSMVERVAMNPDADMAKLEKMLDMQERVLKRDAELAFNSAMADMQAKMPMIGEDAKIEHKGQLISRYATFEHINEKIRPLLSEHGFSITFKTDFANDKLHVTGIVSHRQGHREETTIVLPFDTSGSKNNVQAVASSVSYGKRYTLCMLLNISTGGEDDDGNKAGRGETITEEQAAEIEALITEVNAHRPKILEVGESDTIEGIRADRYERIIAGLERMRK